MKSPAALLALLALLALPATAGAEDHYAREVQARFGAPATRDTVSCGADGSGATVRCLRWRYDSAGTHALFYFEAGSERLLEVFTWDEGLSDAVDASEHVRSLLKTARNVSEQ
jgi:hypothetical protein